MSDRTRSLIGERRERAMPTRRSLIRRRLFIRAATVLLPAFALALLSAIALWPHIAHMRDRDRVTYKRMTSIDGVQASVLRAPHYRGADERDNPYTITADTAAQVSPERVDMIAPKGDGTGTGGAWHYLEAERGVYMQHDQILDLSGHVKLYRDDGLTLRTESLTVDLRAGLASGAEPVRVEGPFGTVDAMGVVVTDKGAVLHFPGPATLVTMPGGGK